MAIGIKLQRYGMTTYVDGRTQGYRMRVVVVEVVGVDDALFAYQVVPAVGGGTEYSARFSHICSPADIEEFPKGAAESGKDFFRLTEIDIIFRNLKLLEDAWEKIQNDFTELVRTLENMNNLSLTEEVTFGSFPRRLHPLPVAREIARPTVPLTPRRTRGKLPLTDAILLSLSKRSDIISKFPFFRLSGKIATGTCGGCGGGAKRNKRMEELTRVKAAIVGLPQGQKDLLKAILKAETITLYLPGAGGTISHTF